MLKNWKKKLIAMLLIFTLTFSNFALITKTYASSILGGIFGEEDSSDTGSSNIEFDACFVDLDNTDTKSAIVNVNNEELNIKMKVNVKSGYLKDAKIILGNGEGLNFQSALEVLENDKIQTFENNEISLIQLNGDTEAVISFPIKYKSLKYVDSKDLSKTNMIKFEGIYVSEDAKEISVSKEVGLKLSWIDDREVKVNSEVTKYIGYTIDGTPGIILQTSIKVDNTTSAKSLPIKKSLVNIQVPLIDNVKPETVNVIARSLQGTMGKQNDEIVFDKNNWNYDLEKNILTIEVENKPELVSIQNENDVLKDENAPEEERYYSSSGVDEYLITYTFKGTEQNSFNLESSIKAELEMFGDYKLTSDKSEIYEVSEQIGDIVTYHTESLTNSISKGYTYLNYNNEENKYEVEIDNKMIFNISYKDIVDSLHYEDINNLYVSKLGEQYINEDIYYKSLKVSKNNFDEILGEDGYINIYDKDGNLIGAINKETKVLEDGNYEIKFENSVKWIKVDTSKPIADGNLNLSTVKAYSKVNYTKEDYKNFEKLLINGTGKVKYTYLNELADCGTEVIEVKLNDTLTDVKLEVGQESLSTLAMNNNVELKLELNNETINSDVYGNSEFEIKMPKYVESLEVTDTSIVYGDGLDISSVEGYEQNGDIFLKIRVSGKQSSLSSGIISNGTNIVLNTNMKVDLYAPAVEDNFELRYYNNEATTYMSEDNGKGYSEAKIKYSAPSGVVSVNSITNYKDEGSAITSINQGKQIGEIAIYSNSKNATMELTIMNNEENKISNLAILGRIPFEGVKDIETNENLGTTITAKMISGIIADSSNNANFKIYYSENGEATKDLLESTNGWTENVENFENVKSYLIVPEDSNYEMEAKQKIRFSYNFEIPENLAHNEEIYGTFGTYYTNNTNVATLNELKIADLVGLTTGVGPELNIQTSLSDTNLNEFEKLEITTKVSNIGKVEAKNVKVEVLIPEYTSYENYRIDNEDINVITENNKVIFEIKTLEVGKEINLITIVSVDEIYLVDDEDVSFEVYSSVTADRLDVILQTEKQTVMVKQADMQISIDTNTNNIVIPNNYELELTLKVKNLKSEELKNIVTTMILDKTFEFNKAYVVGFAEDGLTMIEETVAEYDESTRTITWKFDNMDSLYVKTLKLYLNVNLSEEDITKKDVVLVAKTQADGTESYEAVSEVIHVGKPKLVITQTSLTPNTYVKEGEIINYRVNVKNEGSVVAQTVVLTDEIPNGLVVKSISYESSGIVVNKSVSEKDEVVIGTTIEPNETLEVNIGALATSLNGVQELSVTNSATVTAEDTSEIKSNEITHIIEASSISPTVIGESSNGVASSNTNSSSNSFIKTYKIEGTAWLDKNKDGMRNNDEELMKGIKATLVDSDKGLIKQTVVTNSKGEYTFTGVTNGNYIIIFDYDTVRYTVTTYRKENITSNVNSDVITTKIEQDGVQRNGAVTDVITIADGSISNIDIGLIDALKFDLSLDMGITKTTVQNSKGTETLPYNGVKLTKTEIGAKQMVGSVVYIEYTFTVRNEGEVSGYAKKIVDYVPENMNFNSGLNSDWYTGNDGNLYTNALANVEIMPGEIRTFKLVLSRTMTNNNTGVVTNTAEICEDYNIYGISDLDSTPGNRAQNEDDFSRADSYLSVKTGEEFIYISVIITTILLVGVAVTIVVLKLKYRIAKGGV